MRSLRPAQVVLGTAVALAALTAAPPGAAPEAIAANNPAAKEQVKASLEGHWKSRIDRHDVMLVVSQGGNTWGVRMIYFDRAGRETGIAHGIRYVFANEKLTFERVWDKKPGPNAHEHSACGLTLNKEGDLEMVVTYRKKDDRYPFRRMTKAEIDEGRPILDRK